MSRIGVKLRCLPDGDFQEGHEIGRKGRMLELDLSDEARGFPRGALLEIECGSMLYLGELQERIGSTAVVLVEHAVDRARLASIQDAWD